MQKNQRINLPGTMRSRNTFNTKECPDPLRKEFQLVVGIPLGTMSLGVEGSGQAKVFCASGPGLDYESCSSGRWKAQVNNLTGVLDMIKEIGAYRYTWDLDHGGHEDVGFIAVEVMQVFPEITSPDADAPGYATGMDYSRMTVVLVAALKEQQIIIDDLSVQMGEMQSAFQILKTMQDLLEAQQLEIEKLKKSQ